MKITLVWHVAPYWYEVANFSEERPASIFRVEETIHMKTLCSSEKLAGTFQPNYKPSRI
jgi:hypothetical protein